MKEKEFGIWDLGFGGFKKMSFLNPPILNICSPKFHGLVLGLIG
jgi:hypothetical protein